MSENIIITISLLLPIVFAVSVILLKINDVEWFDTLLAWIVVEHMFIAKFLRVDLEKHAASGGFINFFAFVPWVMLLTLILNYLLTAVIIYGVLTAAKEVIWFL